MVDVSKTRSVDAGKANLQKYHRELTAKREKKIQEKNEIAVQLGPGSYPLSKAAKALNVDNSWLRDYITKGLCFNRVKLGVYSFDFYAYYDGKKLTESADTLQNLVTSFYKEGIAEIERTETFKEADLTSLFGMSDKNASFFLSYVLFQGWVTKNKDGDMYTWTGKDAPVEETPVEETPVEETPVVETPQQVSGKAKAASVGKANLESYRRKQAETEQERVKEANNKGASAGPELFRRQDLIDLFGFRHEWLSQNSKKNFLFKRHSYGVYFFDYKTYCTERALTCTPEHMRDMFYTFYQVAIQNISRQGSFTLADLTGLYEMAPPNADYFMAYCSLYNLCRNDPHNPDTYYWLGEHSEDTPAQKPRRIKILPSVPVVKPVVNTETEEPHRYVRRSKDRPKKLAELLESALDLGPGGSTITRICDGTSVKAYSFPHFRNDLPFIKRMPSRGKQYFDFQMYYDTIKMQTSGVKLSKLVERFYKKSLITLRVQGEFNTSSLVGDLGMASPNALFLVWYLSQHDIIEPVSGINGVFKWMPDPDIKHLADIISPSDEPVAGPDADTPDGEKINDVWLTPTEDEKTPPQPLMTCSQKAELAELDPDTPAQVTGLSASKILDAIQHLTSIVEGQPPHVAIASPQNDNARIAELESALNQARQLAAMAETSLNLGQVIQAGAYVLQIKNMAMPGASSSEAAPIDEALIETGAFNQ